MDAINLDWISEIESSNNPKAINSKSGARGQYQIASALQDWNDYSGQQKYDKKTVMDPTVNKSVADWYFHQRIPVILKSFNVPITKETVLASYNWGPGNVKKWHRTHGMDLSFLPKETGDYIRKYNARELSASIAPIAQEPAPTRGKV